MHHRPSAWDRALSRTPDRAIARQQEGNPRGAGRLASGHGQAERLAPTHLLHGARDVLVAQQAQDRDREVVERRQHPRLIALARPAGVLPQLGAVPHAVHAVLHRAPVVARQFQQLPGPRILRAQVRHVVRRLHLAPLARLLVLRLPHPAAPPRARPGREPLRAVGHLPVTQIVCVCTRPPDSHVMLPLRQRLQSRPSSAAHRVGWFCFTGAR